MGYEVFEKLCEEKGVRPFHVSQETGVATATLTEWKKGTYTPKADKLQKIADYFGVSIDYILTGVHPEQASESGQKYYFSDETAQAAQYIYENKDLRLLFDAARDADPADLKVVHDMLLALKRKERGSDDPA